MPHVEGLAKGHEMSGERRLGKPLPHQVVKCPRCESPDTKFCYFNNYSMTQPRYFCKNCKRYWTHGGALRNVPVGGGLRKNKKSKQKANPSTSSSPPSSTLHHLKPSTSSPSNLDDYTTHSLPNPGYPPSPPNRNYLFNPRIYEAGDHAAHALSYHNLSYKHMPHLYPGYNYPPPPLSMEGLQHRSTEGGLGAAYTVLDPSRSQSNNGEASDISAETRSEAMIAAQFAPPPVGAFNIESSSSGLASDHLTTREAGFRASVARQDHEGPKDNNNNSDGNNNYSNMQSFGYGDELRQAKWRGRAIPSTTDGVLNFDSEEGLANVNNVVNVHDWQQISEGLFGGAGDFFYMPTQYPVTWSDLDAGTSF